MAKKDDEALENMSKEELQKLLDEIEQVNFSGVTKLVSYQDDPVT